MVPTTSITTVFTATSVTPVVPQMGYDEAISSHTVAGETQHLESQFEMMMPEEQIVRQGEEDTTPWRDRRHGLRTNHRQTMCDT